MTGEPLTGRVGYLVATFPHSTQTFVLFEVAELERLGLRVEVHPLRARPGDGTVHPEAADLVRRAHYARLVSPRTLAAQAAWLAERPGAYLGAWWRALAGNAGSPRAVALALAVVPAAARAARELRRAGATHVHAHWATHGALAAFVVHRLTGLPYSFTTHAHDLYVERDRAMLERKAREASFVVTISDFNRRLLGRLYGDWAAAKTSVIRCGVDLSVFAPRPHPAGGPFTVSCVAGLREKKGQRYLIEACGMLAADGVDVRCLLVGDGERRAELEALVAERGLGDRIEFLGRRSRAEVREALGRSHAMALPSVTADDGDMEGIPVALMEAMASGVPVVASALSGIPELVEDGRTGLLVPERDPRALAAAIRRIHDDPGGARARAAAGRERVLEAYDLRRNARALAELLTWRYRPADGTPPP